MTDVNEQLAHFGAQWAVFVEQMAREFERVGEEAAKLTRAFALLSEGEES